MIQFFIKIANNWVGKFLFAAILFGMVFVWGYGGITNTARYHNDAITVGNKSINIQQLDELFKQERLHLSEMTGGQYISPKQAIEMGLLDNVVRQKTNEMIMDNIKEDLGLTASNAAVQKYVERNPNFADATGHFDRNLFLAYLRQMNTNERGLALKLQAELANQHLIRALQAISYAPLVMQQLVYRAQHETRDITAVRIDIPKIQITEQPKQQELQDYYDVYAAEKFMTPEYRSFKYLRLTPEMMLDKVQVSDEEIEMVLDERKDQFITPEKRLIEQMFFLNEADAKKMLSTLTTDNFEKTALEKLGQSTDATNFGYVAQNELMPELAEAAFNAKKGAIVGPIESTTGWHILWVKDIQQAPAVSMEKIRSEIKKQLAQEKVYDARTDLLRQTEDLLGEGKSLTAAAKALKLKLGTVKAVDISGNLKDGTPLEGPMANQELLQNLFTLQTGETTATFETGNSIIIGELTEIIPVGTKSFETVKTELKALWLRERQQEKMNQIVADIMKELQAGKSLSELEADTSFNLIQKKGLSRNTMQADIPAQAFVEIFKQKEGSANAIQVSIPDGIFIAVTNKINRPTVTDNLADTEEAVHELSAGELADGIISTYTDSLGVSVNANSIQQISSIYTTGQE